VSETEKTEDWAFGKVDPYTLVNARLSYRFFDQKVEIALAMYNLFDVKHFEYPGKDSDGNPTAAHEIGSRFTAAFLSYSF